MQQGNRIGLAAVLAYVFTPGLFASTVFNFDDVPDGTFTPFTNTVNGLEASFSSSGGLGSGLRVLPSASVGPFKTLAGNVLTDIDVSSGLTATIDFSAPQTSISMNFATESGGSSQQPIPFDLTAFNGASEVGSTSATGVIPPGFQLPEGVLSFSGPTFDSVVLSTAAVGYAIDNVTVNAALTAPEPSSLSLLTFVGFVGLCAIAITQLRGYRA